MSGSGCGEIYESVTNMGCWKQFLQGETEIFSINETLTLSTQKNKKKNWTFEHYYTVYPELFFNDLKMVQCIRLC